MLAATWEPGVDRKALRGPFFSQCYLTAPFALMLSAGLVLMRMPTDGANLAGAVLALAGIVWYLGIETGAGQALLVGGRDLPEGLALLGPARRRAGLR